VAKAVAEKTHTVENVELVVNLYTPPIPPPSYPNKFLIKGLHEKINETVLGLFLEAKAGCALVPGSLTYHADDDNTAVITVEGDVGMLSLLSSTKLPTHPSFCPPKYPPAHQPIQTHPPTYPLTHPPTHLSIHPSIHLPISS